MTTPIAIALRSTDTGVVVDATMLSEDELSILFGFARSYFHVDLERVADTVAFLKELLPKKPAGELFTVLGRAPSRARPSATAACSAISSTSDDQFVPAPGQRGLVMICFTLPSFDVVFKVIRDHIAEVKSVSKKDVMAKYSFVFRHDRAGRLIDAQEFRRLRFPVARFAAALLDELRAEAGDSVHLAGGDLIFDHLYIERRVTPLDLFLRDATPAAAERAALDYGRAIRDLAYTDVFPGDLLLKNFGVTRHGRVVFYDYDELCRVSECHFRDLPQPQCEEDEMRAEPWFFVGDRDVFPETLPSFLGMSGALREAFLRAHAELYRAGVLAPHAAAHRGRRGARSAALCATAASRRHRAGDVGRAGSGRGGSAGRACRGTVLAFSPGRPQPLAGACRRSVRAGLSRSPRRRPRPR